MTGYEIKKRVGSALKSVTSASYGTLYPTLHRLLDEGAVQMKEYPQAHRPLRKVYAITARGEQELADWMALPAGGDQVRREFYLKLFMAHDLASQQLCAMLMQRREATAAQLAELQDSRAAQNGMPRNQAWVCEYVIEMCHAELDWLDRLIAQIEPGENTDHGGVI
ncbi:MAG: PadR family transcriptional regulator [Anaerolineae bacterium]|nr:PadR family transcriptional regulator [Anaerolineae bacterium]